MRGRTGKIGPEDFDAGPSCVLLGLDAVRKRPSLYLGDTANGIGLHNMIYAVVDNAIAEMISGHADRATVTLHADGSCTVSDNGRGISVEMHKSGISKAEPILTHMLASHDFGPHSSRVSGALRGVNIAMVNAVSQCLHLRVRREGGTSAMTFFHGNPLAPLALLGDAGTQRGTEVSFLPASGVFGSITFEADRVTACLRDCIALNPGIRIDFLDERGLNPSLTRL